MNTDMQILHYKYYPKEIITIFGQGTYVHTLHIFKAPDKERKLPTHHDAADGGLDDDDFSAIQKNQLNYYLLTSFTQRVFRRVGELPDN